MAWRASLASLFIVFFVLPLGGCGLFGLHRGGGDDLEGLGKVHIRYQYTEHDVENPPLAFAVWRSSSQGGAFRRITEEPVAVSRSFRPGDIQLLLTDYGLELGAEYYYYLERIGPDGRGSKAAPVTRARVVLPLDREDRGRLRQEMRRRAEQAQMGERPPDNA